MSRTPNPIPPQQYPPQAPPPPAAPPPAPPAPEPRRRFRWWLVAVPMTCLAFAFLLSGVAPSISFGDIAAAAGATDVARYGMLTILGIILIAFMLLYKSWTQR